MDGVVSMLKGMDHAMLPLDMLDFLESRRNKPVLHDCCPIFYYNSKAQIGVRSIGTHPASEEYSESDELFDWAAYCGLGRLF